MKWLVVKAQMLKKGEKRKKKKTREKSLPERSQSKQASWQRKAAAAIWADNTHQFTSLQIFYCELITLSHTHQSHLLHSVAMSVFTALKSQKVP